MQFATTGSKSSFPFLFHLPASYAVVCPFPLLHTRKPLSFRGLIKEKTYSMRAENLIFLSSFPKVSCVFFGMNSRMLGRCGWRWDGTWKGTSRGRKESSLDDVSEWYDCGGEERGTYCVWVCWRVSCFVCESSYTDLFPSRELWDLIRFWYRVEDASWFFTNVVSLTQLAEHVHDDGNKRVGSFDGYAIPTGENGKKIWWQCLSDAIYSLSSLSCPICFA